MTRISEEAYQLMMRQRKESAKTDLELERDFMRRVIILAVACGWLHYHAHRPRKDRPGFPDLVLVHRGGGTVIFAELKMPRGALTTDQKYWQHALTRTGPGVEYHVWEPSDWDQIAKRLAKRG
ncbi:MAG: VRR-NUC domain-containing protein [Gammaproteobacteria bacterium]